MKFSIIVPIYNREISIQRCIKSVLNQNYLDFELIIINDGSVDGTKTIVENYAKEDSRIVFISYQINHGVNYARNQGIDLATGDYIIFLDSDDYFTYDALNSIYEAIQQFPNYKHYIFTVSDRANDAFLPKNGEKLKYSKFLSDKVTGDFTHVIKPMCFKDKLFFEEYRASEGLNWLRVIKESEPVIFINKVVAVRDRNRKDSLSLKGYTINNKNILEKYSIEKKYFELYLKDLIKYNSLNINRVIRFCIFSKIVKQKDSIMFEILRKSNIYYYYFVRLCPGILLKSTIYTNAKIKRLFLLFNSD